MKKHKTVMLVEGTIFGSANKALARALNENALALKECFEKIEEFSKEIERLKKEVEE